jgi:hypothetical protein
MKRQMTGQEAAREYILWHIAMVSARVLCEIWAEGDEELITETDFSGTKKVTQQLDL